MGVAGLRDAFNSVAAPRFTASLALLSMELRGGKEWSRLIFRGAGANGVAFEVASDAFPAGNDVNEEAKLTAQKLIGGAAAPAT